MRLLMGGAFALGALGTGLAGLLLTELSDNGLHGYLLMAFGNALALLSVGWLYAARDGGRRRAAELAGGAVLLAAAGIAVAGIARVYVLSYPNGTDGLVWLLFGLTYAFVGLAFTCFARGIPSRVGELGAIASTALTFAFACVGLALGFSASLGGIALSAVDDSFEAEAWLSLAPVLGGDRGGCLAGTGA
jgi:hypothetical protein